MLAIQQTRSAAGSTERQKDTLRSLRLGRIGKSAEHADTPQLRGMLQAVGHLVTVREAGSDD